MTLDIDLPLMTGEALSGRQLDKCFTEMQDLNSCDAMNELSSDVSTCEITQTNGESFQIIPEKQTSAHKLRSQQKKAHELLTKCKDICYLITDSSVLESVIQDAESIYSRLIKSSSANNDGEGIPVFPVLAQVSLKKSKKDANFKGNRDLHENDSKGMLE